MSAILSCGIVRPHAMLAYGLWLYAVIPADVLSAQQSNSSQSLSVLQAPPSPAFVLLGIEPASVERPGSVTDFASSFLNATDELSVLPENFAVSIAPFWLFGFGKRISFRDYRNPVDPWSTFLRTVTVSLAFTPTAATSENRSSTSAGLGVRFSLVEGNIDDAANPELVTLTGALQEAADQLGDIKARLMDEDSEYARLGRELGRIDDFIADLNTDTLSQEVGDSLRAVQTAARDMLNRRRGQLDRAVTDQIRSRIGELAGEVRLRRTGPKLDVAGGFVLDFPDRSYADRKLNRWGMWVTGGHEWDWGTLLGVGRYLGTKESVGPNTIDLGGRAVLDGGDRFSFSGEILWRRLLNAESMDVVPADQRNDPNAPITTVSTGRTEWRVALLIDYAIGKNQTLSFTFGRDFEGRQSGNMIASINFLLGLGASRLGALVN